ncbi:MAG TPA: DUF3617 family protein [Methylotenera sp.]|nr:DUF3617 family protein [Methylotenera sp.]
MLVSQCLNVRQIRFGCAIGCLFIISAHAASATSKPNIKPGNWRIAIQMIVPNASGPDTGPMQYERCLNGDNAQQFLAMPPNAPCKLVTSKYERDKLTWELSCSQNGYKSSAKGEVLFHGDTLNGEVITQTFAPQDIKITTKISGRYLGSCIALKPNAKSANQNGLQKFKEDTH